MPRKTLPAELSSISGITKIPDDVRRAALGLTRWEARKLLALYDYLVENYVIAGAAVRSARKQGLESVVIPYARHLISVAANQRLMALLDLWTDGNVASRWARSFRGLGVITAASLLAYIDESICDHVGRIYRFAGFTPNTSRRPSRDQARLWIMQALDLFGQEPSERHIDFLAARIPVSPSTLMRRATFNHTKPLGWQQIETAVVMRPWNHKLRRIGFLAGSSLIQNHTEPYYAWYTERLVRERRKDSTGANQSRAMIIAQSLKSDAIQRETYLSGHFPETHLHAMARRWLVKLFLAHYFKVVKFAATGSAPARPYVLDVMGRTGEIPVPNWPFEGEQPLGR